MADKADIAAHEPPPVLPYRREGSEPAEVPPVLSYRSIRPPDRVTQVANSIVGLSLIPGMLGCFGLFYLIISLVADPSFRRMPAGDVFGAVFTVGVAWLAFALLFASGRALRRGERRGAMACTVVLSLIAAGLVFLLVAMTVDWLMYPGYHSSAIWVLTRILASTFLLTMLTLVAALLKWTIRYMRAHRRIV